MVDLTKLSDKELDDLERRLQAGEGKAAPSTWQDIKNVAGPALARGGLMLGTTPGTLADLAVAGAQKATGALGYPNAEKYLGAVRQQIEPATYGGQLRQLQQSWPGATTQAQTTGGKYAQTGLEFAPGVMGAALSGGESVLPALLKGATSAAGSEAAGQLAEKYQGKLPEWAQPYASPVARMAGALGGWGMPGTARSMVTPHPTTPLRTAQTATLRGAGVPVDVAQATGSPALRGRLGATPGNQDEAVSQAMLKAGGIQVPEESPFHPREIVNARGPELSSQGRQLAGQTPMQVDPTLTTSLGKKVADYANAGASNAPAVQAELDRFNQLHGSGLVPAISGPQYWQLRNEWTSSADPVIRSMGRDLDDAMGRTLANTPQAGAWDQWRQSWADYQGLKTAADQAAARGSTVLDPSTVFSSIERETPLKNLAQSAVAVTKPIEAQPSSGLWPTLAGVGAAAAGFGAGHMGYLPGEMAGQTGDIAGLLLGQTAGPLAAIGANTARRAVTKAASPYLENQLWNPPGKYGGGYPGEFGTLDPQTAARLLAIQSPPRIMPPSEPTQ